MPVLHPAMNPSRRGGLAPAVLEVHVLSPAAVPAAPLDAAHVGAGVPTTDQNVAPTCITRPGSATDRNPAGWKRAASACRYLLVATGCVRAGTHVSQPDRATRSTCTDLTSRHTGGSPAWQDARCCCLRQRDRAARRRRLLICPGRNVINRALRPYSQCGHSGGRY
jgi:hypothetical protein